MSKRSRPLFADDRNRRQQLGTKCQIPPVGAEGFLRVNTPRRWPPGSVAISRQRATISQPPSFIAGENLSPTKWPWISRLKILKPSGTLGEEPSPLVTARHNCHSSSGATIVPPLVESEPLAQDLSTDLMFFQSKIGPSLRGQILLSKND